MEVIIFMIVLCFLFSSPKKKSQKVGKKETPVDDCEVRIDAERADAEPKVFTKIALHFIVTGKNLKETVVKRAVDLSAEKYCSASIMLGRAGVHITHSFEIVESA